MSVRAVAEMLGHSGPGLTATMYPEGAGKADDGLLDLDEADDSDGRAPRGS
jgi:hypothetical protein